MDAWKCPPRWMALSDIRNRSSLEAICWDPLLLLVHVYIPFEVWRSMSWFLYTNSLNPMLSHSNLARPLDFSSNAVMILKFPPLIQRGWLLLELGAMSVFSKSNIFCRSWGKYTLVRRPWILVPIRWKVVWMKKWEAWKSWRERIWGFHKIASPPEAPDASIETERHVVQILFIIFSSTTLLPLVSCRKTNEIFSC